MVTLVSMNVRGLHPVAVGLCLVIAAGCGPGGEDPPPASSEPSRDGPATESSAESSGAMVAARGYFEALHSADWRRFAALLHPDALAEFDGLRARLVALAEQGQEAQVLGLFRDLDSLDALRALPPDRFLVRYMESRLEAQPASAQMLRTTATELIGEVPEGRSVVHVVYRMTGTIRDIRLEQVGVLGVRPVEDGWRPMLSDEFRKLANPDA